MYLQRHLLDSYALQFIDISYKRKLTSLSPD